MFCASNKDVFASQNYFSNMIVYVLKYVCKNCTHFEPFVV